MPETAAAPIAPATDTLDDDDRTLSAVERMRAKYDRDHQNPINHFLHVGVGMPMMSVAVILMFFRPLYGVALFAAGYVVMWLGHFFFEHNLPTVFRDPKTPFIMAWVAVRQILAGIGRLFTGRPSRP